MIARRRFISALAVSAVVLAACAPTPNDSSAQAYDISITIYNDSWSSLQLRYDADHAQDVLTHLTDGTPLYTITPDEIASYNWTSQVLTLTPAATQDLTAALKNATYGQQSVLIEFYDSIDFGNALDRALYTKAFVVTIDGQPIYGGIFLDLYSQMAIDYPVMRIWERDGSAQLALLPTHLPFSLVDDPRSTFATDNTAVFRDLIRDDRVRELFESQDKLVESVDPHNG